MKKAKTKTKNVERHAGGLSSKSILNRTHPFILMIRTHQTFNWDLTF